ncbi:MAG TPA: iron-containing redox enzyme family protein [Acidimicrobiia bacterium]|nr:iron-containing redox enzyme family protein [Acidimicrobiia bacterium]
MVHPRGPRSAFLLEHLARPVHELPLLPDADDDPLAGEDTQLLLYLCYELHYRGLPGVDDGWEWEPTLLAARARVEAEFDAAIREAAGGGPRPPDLSVVVALKELLTSAAGPSLSRYMVERGTLDQFREFAVHRSAYQLKEADPHTWAIPRLSGRAKSALVEIQADEYGGGQPGESHAELFAATMVALDLDPAYGAFLDRIPAPTLATVNLISSFGLHRRWRGALIGHLAAFEMTSVEPMGRYAAAARRFGLPDAAAWFYDVHVLADAHHQEVAATDLAGGLAESEPGLAADILFGARALMAVEERFARHLLDAWTAGRSSLRPPD